MEAPERAPRRPDGPAAAFYCVADERYFPGVVALVNSLRLVGHSEPIHVLDCGLTASQRERLAAEATLIDDAGVTPPWLLKTVAPLARPAATVALLDADLVATRSLIPLLGEAAATGLVAFENPVQRHVPEWGELLDLGPVRRQAYASSAAIFAEGGLARELLSLMSDRQRAVDFERTYWRSNEDGYAFTFADQDVFNAILASRIDPAHQRLHRLELAPTPPFTGLRVADLATLRCAYADGSEPYLVHHHTVKPWLEPTHHGVYSQLLHRLLTGDDVAIRVPDEQIPRRLRRGARAYAERKRINARERWRWHVGDPLRSLTGRGERPR